MAGPFSSAHFYVQWGGPLPGDEEWSCGFRMLNPGGHSVSDSQAMLVGVSAAVASFHTRAGTQIGSQARLGYVKVNSISTNGLYTQETTQQATFANLPGSGTASPYPNQVALVVTLETGFSRGVANKGRFYLPLPIAPVASDGRIESQNAQAVDTSAELLRTNVNAVVPGYVMAVMSRKAGAPGARAVTSCTVGRVLDTQRRRRRSLVE